MLTSQRQKTRFGRMKMKFNSWGMLSAGAVTATNNCNFFLYMRSKSCLIFLFLQCWRGTLGCAKTVWGVEAETGGNRSRTAQPVSEDDCRGWWPEQNQDQSGGAAHRADKVWFFLLHLWETGGSKVAGVGGYLGNVGGWPARVKPSAEHQRHKVISQGVVLAFVTRQWGCLKNPKLGGGQFVRIFKNFFKEGWVILCENTFVSFYKLFFLTIYFHFY